MKKLFALLFAAACLATTVNAQINLGFSVKIIPDEPVAPPPPPPPSENHVWIDGEWVWQNNQYVKQPGHWVVPEPDHVWLKGEWQKRPDGSVYWEPGYWKQVEHMGVPNWMPEPYYLRPPAPGFGYVWVYPEWVWRDHHYEWQAGTWAIPEPNRVPTKGHWARWPNGEWYWVKGYWKRLPSNMFIKVIPPDPVVVRPPAPSPNHIWIEGEWIWQNNTFAWHPGYWIVKDPHKVWVRGYWHQRQDGGFYWVEGHWDWV